jgi:hypothetical protein
MAEITRALIARVGVDLAKHVSADPIVPVSSRSESAGFSLTSLSCIFFKEVLTQPSSFAGTHDCPQWRSERGNGS